jgi:hypothetical protein
MEYTGKDGAKSKVRASTIARMRHVRQHHSIGRFLNAPSPLWKVHEVRALQDAGIWEVEWVEPGDHDRKGAWCIRGLTPFGVELLEKWERVVERREATKGPKRRQPPTAS